MDWTKFPKQDFLDTLEVCDKVAVRDWLVNNDDIHVIAQVIEVTEQYIRVDRYPDVWFEPRTGLEIPDPVNKRTAYANRKLFPAAIELARIRDQSLRAKLIDKIRTIDGTITLEMYQKCLEVIDQAPGQK